MRLIIFYSVIVFLFACNCFAATSYTATASDASSVRTAISSCVGDAECETVYAPAGTYDWTGQVEVDIRAQKVNFRIIGDGKSQTIFTRDDKADSSLGWFDSYMSSATPVNNISGVFEVSGIGFYSTTLTNIAINMRNCNSFVIKECHFEGYWHNVITYKNMDKGVISNCTFVNHNDPYVGSYYGVSIGQRTQDLPTECDTICDCSVGSPSYPYPEERNTTIASGNTVIASAAAVINNVGGTGSGVIRRLYIDLATADANATINVASFTNGGGNTFSYHARQAAVTVKPGLNILSVDNGRLTAFDIENGEYIGVYLNNCTLSANTGTTSWTVAGDQTDQASVAFSQNIGTVSIWGEIYDDEGDYAACEAGWESYWYGHASSQQVYYSGWPTDGNWAYDANALFIEGCTFDWYKTLFEANWCNGGKVVMRHNNIAGDYGQNYLGWKHGTIAMIFHNNIMTDTSPSPPSALRARRDFLIYDNEFTHFSTALIILGSRSGYGGYYPPDMRPKEGWFWNNTLTNVTNTFGYGESEGETWIGGEGEYGSFRAQAPVSGERLYGFTEYTCPHPLTGYSGSCGDGAGVSYYNVGGNPGTGSCAGGGSGSAAGGPGATGSMSSQ